MSEIIRIEQHLQDPPSLMGIPSDELLAIALPSLISLLAKSIFFGIWRRLKGDNGLRGMLARSY